MVYLTEEILTDVFGRCVMHKTAILLIALVIMITAGCTNIPSETDNADVSPVISAEQPLSSPTPTENERSQIKNDERAEIFRIFLKDNYTTLATALYGGIAGIGFADLDCDGGMEMILFDAGASASMGVQFFDIIDGNVECVSANIADIGESLGGKYYSEIVVNANYFDDFRFMTDQSSGENFFLVESSNGAVDFNYKEKIRFGADGEILTLESLSYIYNEYNDDGELTNSLYKLGTMQVTEDEYKAAVDKLENSLTDRGLEIKGKFVWEKSGFSDDLDSLLEMAEEALVLGAEQIDLY